MALLQEKSVIRVQKALAAANHDDGIIELDKSARTVADAAKALGVATGSIAVGRVFKIGGQYVVAMLAGDQDCLMENLPRVLSLKGEVEEASEDETRKATGFRSSCISPVAMPKKLPMVIDRSLKRFETLYAYAGHRRCLFATTAADLKRLTGAIVSYNIAEPSDVASDVD